MPKAGDPRRAACGEDQAGVAGSGLIDDGLQLRPRVLRRPTQVPYQSLVIVRPRIFAPDAGPTVQLQRRAGWHGTAVNGDENLRPLALREHQGACPPISSRTVKATR